MDVTIGKSSLSGRASAPPSKSYTHRAVLAAGYADGATVRDALVSADTKATMAAVEAFGGSIERGADAGTADLEIEGFDGAPGVPEDVINCENSGTTMRLVTATAALADGVSVLTGDASLRSRPQGPLLDAIGQLGGEAESTRGNGQAPLVVRGPLAGGAVELPGDVSSQFVTALLMAGAVTAEGSEIELTTELKSAPYVDITVELLAEYGVEVERTGSGFAVAGGQSYRPEGGEYAVPGDFSSISYLVAAGALAADDGESVVVEGARPSAQGDTAILDVVERMGGRLVWDEAAGEVEVRKSKLSGVEVDVGDTPDLLPTIAVLGAVAEGETRIVNCEHVRYKETDRVSVMADSLEAMGAEVEEYEDELVVRGSRDSLHGADLSSHGDHRIAMALSVLGLVADDVLVADAENVEVSFPGSFDTLEALGADVGRA
jgi:3-phosphoshikimate 1-carboxyvinyltransferase